MPKKSYEKLNTTLIHNLNKKVKDLKQSEEKFRNIFKNEFKLQSQGKKTLAEDIPILRKDGDIIFTDVNSMFITIKNKPYLLGNFRDITNKKETEEKLKYFQKAIDESSDAIGMSTPEGKHYYQNRAFDKLFGLPVKEVGKKEPPSTVYADEKIGKEVFKTIMAGGSWTGKVKMFDKNKKKMDIFLRAYSIKDKKGKVIGLVGVHTLLKKIK